MELPSAPEASISYDGVDARTTAGGGTNCWNAGDPMLGADLIVGGIDSFGNFPSESGVEAFSLGETVCNIGSHLVNWEQGTADHPVAGQNLFRLQDGRFEQIGQAWVFHEFFALPQNSCGCGCSGPGGDVLGVGCSNPHVAGYLGFQENLGPKSEINAFTGVFPFPPSSPGFAGSVARRLQLKISDLDPALEGGGLYFAEIQYIAKEDAAAGLAQNNASYRLAVITGGGAAWNAALTGSVQRERPGIGAWKDHDPDVVETKVQIPGEGILMLAAKAVDLGDGFWHYEYALQNLNSDRSAGTFSVPVGPHVTVRNIGFHDVDYHSGEPFDGTDWPGVRGPNAITWSTTPYEENSNANALRWGTLYNFRFEADVSPDAADVTIGLFKPGTPASVAAAAVGPGGAAAPAISPFGAVLSAVLLLCAGGFTIHSRGSIAGSSKAE